MEFRIEDHPALWRARALTRRHFFGRMGMGFGAIALSALDEVSAAPPAPRREGQAAHSNPTKPARAKAVIYLHMAGAPSTLDLFEHKPELVKVSGQKCPDSFLAGKRFAFLRGVPRMLASPFAYRQHGQSGQWISELLPRLGSVADELCVLRGMTTDQFNHAPAQLFVQTGNARLGYPSMGSWVTYGLGTANRDLPGFVVLCSGGKVPDAGKSVWGSGFLPGMYQGIQCRTDGGDPVLFLSDPKGVDRGLRRKTLDALRDLNTRTEAAVGDPETRTRISQYELAFRMQVSVPDVMDISKEPQHILDLYGARPGHVSAAESADDPRQLYRGDDPTFANNCLLARRLVEKGVRFVQLYDWGWDHHGISPGESIDETLPIKARYVDRAIAGLIADLKQRGMLDSTLVVWGGEFGRTPMLQDNGNADVRKGFFGRDHHPHGFTMWMAGGGIKRGLSYGATDEMGYYAAENKTTVRDLQATILQAVGLDPYRFHYPYQGLDQRLIGPTDEGRVLRDVLA